MTRPARLGAALLAALALASAAAPQAQAQTVGDAERCIRYAYADWDYNLSQLHINYFLTNVVACGQTMVSYYKDPLIQLSFLACVRRAVYAAADDPLPPAAAADDFFTCIERYTGFYELYEPKLSGV